MDQTKSFEEKYAEIQKKLQAAIGGIISDIAKTDGGLERLQVMHDNHAKLTKYDLNCLTDSRENSE